MKLSLASVGELSELVEMQASTLRQAASRIERYIGRYSLIKADKPDRRRPVVVARGPIREFQERFLRRVLLQVHLPSVHSHGGIPGRDIKTNAKEHMDSRWIYKTDISEFFPSIHSQRVQRLFGDKLGCGPDVARLCTRLCTVDFHPAQGLITSPMIAEMILAEVDQRIEALCKKTGLRYSRFVDDLAISASYNLEKGTLPEIVEKILASVGFKTNMQKRQLGLVHEIELTNLRMSRSHLDVRQEYIEKIEHQIECAACLAEGRPITTCYYTRTQVYGRILYVGQIRGKPHRDLLDKFENVDWRAAAEQALRLGLLSPCDRLEPRKRKLRSVWWCLALTDGFCYLYG